LAKQVNQNQNQNACLPQVGKLKSPCYLAGLTAVIDFTAFTGFLNFSTIRRLRFRLRLRKNSIIVNS
jgi:hypothetical protein